MPILSRRAWRAMPYTDDPRPWRRLACAMLLDAALGAHAGRRLDTAWLASSAAKSLADLIGLPAWPPSSAQLASKRELHRRAGRLPKMHNARGDLWGASIGGIRKRRRRDAQAAKQSAIVLTGQASLTESEELEAWRELAAPDSRAAVLELWREVLGPIGALALAEAAAD